MYDQNAIVEFIDRRLGEDRRLALLLAQTPEMPVQAGADQLERTTEALNEVVTFIQYLPEDPLTPVVLKKIAHNWAYHDDYNDAWTN